MENAAEIAGEWLSCRGQPSQVLDEALKPKTDTILADKLQKLNDKLKAAGIDAPDAFLGTEKLIEVRKTLDEKIKEDAKNLETARMEKKNADDQLKEASKKLEAAEGKLKDVSAKLAEVNVKEPDPVKAIDELTAERKQINEFVDSITKKLIAKGLLFDNSRGRAELLLAVDRLIGEFQRFDPQGRIAALLADLNNEKEARKADNKRFMDELAVQDRKHKDALDEERKRSKEDIAKEQQRQKEVLSQRHTPQEMLPIWMLVLQDRKRTDMAKLAAQDAKLVEEEAANDAVKAEAKCVRGVALRNQGKFDEAGGLLKQALKDAGAAKEEWHVQANQVLFELAAPANYYLPRADELHAAAQYQPALEVLNEGMKAFPPESRGLFLAVRSQVWLDWARSRAGGARLTGKDAGVEDARQDATNAITAGAVAEGNFAAGRVAEELGSWVEARDAYQRALAAHPAADRDGSRYRIALARVLVRIRQETPPGTGNTSAPPAEAAPGRAEGKLSDKERALKETIGKVLAQVARKDEKALEMLAALILVVGPDRIECPPGGPCGCAGSEEATKLADEVLASRDADFVSRSQAWAIKGMWTKALQTYVEGLQTAPGIRSDYSQDLLRLVYCHPAFRRPESLCIPNPLEAERHYTSALHFMEACKYRDAECELIEAIRNDCQDARYFYFLGLSRLAQDRCGEAYVDFEEASKLEQEGRPGRAAVSASLERVQGPPRQVLDRFRK